MVRTNKLGFVVAGLVGAILVGTPVLATRISASLTAAVTQKFPGAHVRLDGSIETAKGDLYLPIMPSAALLFHKGNVSLLESYPTNAAAPDLLSYSNGWVYLKVLKKGVLNTVVVPAELPEHLRRQVLSGKMPADLIVPQNMIVARSLKPVIGEVSIATADDTTAGRADFGQPPPKKRLGAPLHGTVFVTSPHTGDITQLDETTLTKIMEFPTEGTPTGMAGGSGKLYIADQAKSRILLLDLKSKQFLGQIDLTKKSAPKGLAILPNGKLLYASESAANDVAVIETASNKVLVRTRVSAGPARIEITPNGSYVVVLNVPAAQATIISTLNQRNMGAVAVGAMPNAVVISKDSTRAYISNRMSNTVSVVDIMSHRVVETLKTGTGPTGLALSADGNKLFVANAKDNTISVFDLKTKQKPEDVKLPLDVDFPGDMVVMPGGKRMVITSETTDAVGIFNMETLQFEAQPNIGHSSDEIIWVPIE
ncbi:MAG TPA: beta-propeller fold lactonase family protein [Trichormus sp.]